MFPKPQNPVQPQPTPTVTADAGVSNFAQATRRRTAGAKASLMSTVTPSAPVGGKTLMGQ